MVSLNSLNKNSNKNQSNERIEIFDIPNQLMQYYMKLRIEEKLDTLFSFLKTHPKSKILVFLSSCKQTRFVYESFKKLKIGLPVFEMHGRQKQV